jgi:hypothetical protein
LAFLFIHSIIIIFFIYRSFVFVLPSLYKIPSSSSLKLQKEVRQYVPFPEKHPTTTDRTVKSATLVPPPQPLPCVVHLVYIYIHSWQAISPLYNSLRVGVVDVVVAPAVDRIFDKDDAGNVQHGL